MNTLKIGLCEGRHNIEGVTEYIFGNTIEDVTDITALNNAVYKRLKDIDCDRIDLYVTGLTVALVAVINYCNFNKVPLTLWHYNSATGTYYPQEIVEDIAWNAMSETE